MRGDGEGKLGLGGKTRLGIGWQSFAGECAGLHQTASTNNRRDDLHKDITRW